MEQAISIDGVCYKRAVKQSAVPCKKCAFLYYKNQCPSAAFAACEKGEYIWLRKAPNDNIC